MENVNNWNIKMGISYILDNIICNVVNRIEGDDEVVEVAVPEKPAPECVMLSSSSSSSSSDDASADEQSDQIEVSDSSIECYATSKNDSTSSNEPKTATKSQKSLNSKLQPKQIVCSTDKPTLNAQYVVVKTNYLYNVYQSIKNEIWCSTSSGNITLDSLYSKYNLDGPIYLLTVYKDQYLYGIAQMMSNVDYNKEGGNVWVQDLRDDGLFCGQIKIRLISFPKLDLERLRKFGINKHIGFVTKLNYQNGMSVFKTLHNYAKTQSHSILDFFGSELKKEAQKLGDEKKATAVFFSKLKKEAKLVALHRRVCQMKVKYKVACSKFPLCTNDSTKNKLISVDQKIHSQSDPKSLTQSPSRYQNKYPGLVPSSSENCFLCGKSGHWKKACPIYSNESIASSQHESPVQKTQDESRCDSSPISSAPEELEQQKKNQNALKRKRPSEPISKTVVFQNSTKIAKEIQSQMLSNILKDPSDAQFRAQFRFDFASRNNAEMTDVTDSICCEHEQIIKTLLSQLEGANRSLARDCLIDKDTNEYNSTEEIDSLKKRLVDNERKANEEVESLKKRLDEVSLENKNMIESLQSLKSELEVEKKKTKVAEDLIAIKHLQMKSQNNDLEKARMCLEGALKSVSKQLNKLSK